MNHPGICSAFGKNRVGYASSLLAFFGSQGCWRKASLSLSSAMIISKSAGAPRKR